MQKNKNQHCFFTFIGSGCCVVCSFKYMYIFTLYKQVQHRHMPAKLMYESLKFYRPEIAIFIVIKGR